MKNLKKIFLGTIFILIGIALVYLGYRRETKSEIEPSKNKYSKSDSTANSVGKIMPVGIGKKPEVDSKDGSVKIVEGFIKSNSKNPATFIFLEWSEVTSEDNYWKVRCKYTGISSFNAEVTTNAWFYIRNNTVVHTKIISKI